MKLCPGQHFVMHGQTDRHTDRVTPVYPTKFRLWGCNSLAYETIAITKGDEYPQKLLPKKLLSVLELRTTFKHSSCATLTSDPSDPKTKGHLIGQGQKYMFPGPAASELEHRNKISRQTDGLMDGKT